MSHNEESHWLGFDLGGTKMLGVLFDSQFRPVARKRKKTKGYEGEQSGVARIIETIHQTLQEAELDVSQLSGIGIGCPGPVNMQEGVVYEAVNLGWTNVRLRNLLEKHFSCPVEITNDVDAGVYAEYRFGAAQGARTVLGVFPGTGIGGGCVYEGDILRGREISCMELGHLRVQADGPLCGCGGRGCLESVASRLAIAAEAARAAYRGQAPYLRNHVGTCVEDIRSSALAEAIAHGDRVIEQIVRNAATALGRAVGSIVQLLAPDVVVLGGGLVEAMPQLYVPVVLQVAEETVMTPYRGTFRVVAAQLGDDATALGAAAWVEKRHGASVETFS
jgi:glucokinase